MKMEDLDIKIFADSASITEISSLAHLPHIKGFTTNPTLMRKSYFGAPYETWARQAVLATEGKPISFEVLSDDFGEMEGQARKIASWGESVYVKIPITDTQGRPSTGVIERLSHDGIKVNVTAVMTQVQVYVASLALCDGAPSIISVFAGRIADTGEDEEIFMCEAKDTVRDIKSIELLWASVREVGNVVAADTVGVDIITCPPDILAKLPLIGRDLTEFSRETVEQFARDAREAGYTL